eukprot:jgi/Chrzof1/12617/Cz07g01100.t1
MVPLKTVKQALSEVPDATAEDVTAILAVLKDYDIGIYEDHPVDGAFKLLPAANLAGRLNTRMQLTIVAAQKG